MAEPSFRVIWEPQWTLGRPVAFDAATHHWKAERDTLTVYDRTTGEPVAAFRGVWRVTMEPAP